MPQLVKGGKYIFGWSKVGENGKLIIPEEAYLEYKLNEDDKGILISGSKRSGGFGLSSSRLLKNSPIGKMLEGFPELLNHQLEEGKLFKIKEKNYCWITIYKSGIIEIPQKTLRAFNIKLNDNLLVGRGSGLALGFIAKGPIYEEAKKHPEIPYF
ncbi:MAG: hypothetical protein ACFFBZ_04730 [Promethearchaeota archaeon]